MSETTPLSVFEPAGEAKGGLVVIQEVFGVNDHIEDVCRPVRRRGLARGGAAPVPPQRRPEARLRRHRRRSLRTCRQLTADGVLADVDAALGHLADAGIAPVRASASSGSAWAAASPWSPRPGATLGAAVTFYGGGVDRGPLRLRAAGRARRRSLRTPWLGLFGDQDQAIPVERRRGAARRPRPSRGQPTEIVRYPDAGHGFNCDQRQSYHEASAHDAWRRMDDGLAASISGYAQHRRDLCHRSRARRRMR